MLARGQDSWAGPPVTRLGQRRDLNARDVRGILTLCALCGNGAAVVLLNIYRQNAYFVFTKKSQQPVPIRADMNE